MRRFWADWRTRASLAHRTLVVYVLSVLVPCLLGCALTYHYLRQDLETHARTRLLESARLHGLAVFSRLANADRLLERLNSNSIPMSENLPVRLDAESPLSSVSLVRLNSTAEHGEQDEYRARSRELAGLAEQSIHSTALHDSTIVFAHEDSQTLPVLVRQVPGGGGLFAIGWLRPDYLWGGTEMPAEDVQLCIAALHGSFRICRPQRDQAGTANIQERAQSDCLVVRWPLFLRARFGIDDWSVELSQPHSSVLAPLTTLQFAAVPLLGATIVLTLFLGSALIRRSFNPLERLLAGWSASHGNAAGSGVAEQLSSYLALSATRLEGSRRLLEVLTQLDRKILVAGSLQTTILWLLPKIAGELRTSGAAVVFAQIQDEVEGSLCVATSGSPPSCSPCDVSIQNVRDLVDTEAPITFSNFEGALFTELTQRGFRVGRAYPIRDERHLVGALLLLDLPDIDANTQSEALAFSDGLSVAVSHWRRKEELARAMHFDSLTGLANRELLLERLGRALATSTEGRSLAVIVIGLDGFEEINATLGHRAGDELLRLAAYRIRSVVRETQTLARLTGNEIVLLVPDLDELTGAAQAAQRVVALFQKPFLAEGLSYAVSVSVGIAVAPADGLTPEGLIRSAGTAMRRAKTDSAGRVTFFKEVMNEGAKRRIWLEHGLREAIGTRELQLHFQPKIELATGRVIGAEALLRWMHPTEGLIPPAEFIPTAEASGLIVPIGQWVLEESCRRMLEWRRAGVHLDHIAVNLSLRQLQDDSFLEHLYRYLCAGGIDGRSLELEVTESMFAEQPGRLASALEKIRSRGVRIAIDDFGTGYSSLALLQLLPVDVLKIDRAFVREMESGTGDAIVKAIIALGLALGKDIVAEGVETVSQARALEQRGCGSAQGFYFAPPLPSDQFIRFFDERQGVLEREWHALRA